MSSIAKNTAWMTLASVGQKMISFVYFTLIARSIGVEGTGKYFFALSFTTIFVVFVDLGLTSVLVREAAKTKEKIQDYVSTILSVKVVLGLLSYAVVLLAINLLGYSAETKHLVYLSGVTMLFDSLHLTLYGVLRALNDLRYEAMSIVGSQLLTLILGSSFLLAGLPLIFLILAFTIPSFINVCFALTVLCRKYCVSLRPRYEGAIFRHLARMAAPFAVAAILARFYSYTDSILLSKLAGDVAVGLYSIPYKITYAFQFVPLALVAALYPRFSEYFEGNQGRLAYVFERGIKYLLIMVLPIVVGISLLAKDIVLSVYTAEYLNSIIPLQILLAGLIFSYVSFPIGAFLNACNRQTTQTVIVAIVLAVNVVLNIVLIPRLGVVGAAISALAGNILLTVLGYAVVPSIANIHHGWLAKTVLQVVTAAGVMGIFVWRVNAMSHFTVAILAGAVVYPLMLIVLRVVTVEQLKEAVRLVKY